MAYVGKPRKTCADKDCDELVGKATHCAKHCTRCGSQATTFHMSLTGVPVARCRSCAVVDAAAMARKGRAGTPPPGRSPDTAGRGDSDARGSGGLEIGPRSSQARTHTTTGR